MGNVLTARVGKVLDIYNYLDFIARMTSHIPDKGQVMVRYYGLYANAHRGKAKKASLVFFALRLAVEEPKPDPRRAGPR
jgi:hypothetical protein